MNRNKIIEIRLCELERREMRWANLHDMRCVRSFDLMHVPVGTFYSQLNIHHFGP